MSGSGSGNGVDVAAVYKLLARVALNHRRTHPEAREAG